MYLEDEDPVQGEAYINRAAQLQTLTKDDNLQIIYKVCQGRVFDYKRKFIEAASRYIFYIYVFNTPTPKNFSQKGFLSIHSFDE